AGALDHRCHARMGPRCARRPRLYTGCRRRSHAARDPDSRRPRYRPRARRPDHETWIYAGAADAGTACDADMKTCLFVGPTLSGETIASGIQRFGPVAMGSVFRAVEAGYLRIGIVDGYFGNVPSVWHKEILFA